MISSYIFLSICLATSVSIAETKYGYEYDYDYWEDPHESWEDTKATSNIPNKFMTTAKNYDYWKDPHESWEDTKATSNIPKFMKTAKNGQISSSNPSQNTVSSRRNWTPAPPKRRTFQTLIRDVFSERQSVFGIPFGVAVGFGGNIANAWYTTTQAIAINTALTSVSRRVDSSESQISALATAVASASAVTTTASTSTSAATVCAKVNSIVDASAAIGSQTISASPSSANTNTLPTQASVQTAINNIQVALDKILALTAVTC